MGDQWGSMENVHGENKQHPVGLLGREAFPCPPFLVRNRFHDLPWGIPEGLLIRAGRGCRDKGGAVRKQECSLRAGPDSTWRDTHNNTFELLQNCNPQQVEAFFTPQKTNWGQIKETKKVIKIRRQPEAKLKECRCCTHLNLISNPALEPSL